MLGLAGLSSAPAELSLDLIQWYMINIYAPTNAVLMSKKEKMLRSKIVDDLESL